MLEMEHRRLINVYFHLMKQKMVMAFEQKMQDQFLQRVFLQAILLVGKVASLSQSEIPTVPQVRVAFEMFVCKPLRLHVGKQAVCIVEKIQRVLKHVLLFVMKM